MIAARLVGLALVALVALSFAGALGCGAPLPAPIAAAQRAAPPGHVVVVEFVDFECPFCRRMHAALAPVVARRVGRVHIARKQVPLPMHPHAALAARASVCADRLGAGDAMADALFRAPPASLTPDGIEELGARAGLDRAALRGCLADPRTAQQVDDETALFDAVGGSGVPLVFIGRERFEGAEDEATLDAAIARALAAAGDA